MSRDLQEMFDISVSGLLKQNKKSKSEDGHACLYRAPDGSKCAAGLLIPDESYDEKFESHACLTDMEIKDLMFDYSIQRISTLEKLREAIGIDTIEKQELIRKLQRIHDDSEIASWRLKFYKVAEDFSLNTNVLNNLNSASVNA